MAKESNPLLFRYPPNNRFINGGFKDQVEVKTSIETFGESVTDKESYRISLAGKRGAIGSGYNNTGWYMFPDGKYDHTKDFSYFYRKDLTIVDIDNYINQMQEALEKSDKELAKEIQAQIDIANNKKSELKEKGETPDVESTSE